MLFHVLVLHLNKRVVIQELHLGDKKAAIAECSAESAIEFVDEFLYVTFRPTDPFPRAIREEHASSSHQAKAASPARQRGTSENVRAKEGRKARGGGDWRSRQEVKGQKRSKRGGEGGGDHS